MPHVRGCFLGCGHSFDAIEIWLSAVLDMRRALLLRGGKLCSIIFDRNVSNRAINCDIELFFVIANVPDAC